tara:strand:+ start:24636 stop:25421 length:786 start_codon:yes stop_codon:yes gene_type:complete
MHDFKPETISDSPVAAQADDSFYLELCNALRSVQIQLDHNAWAKHSSNAPQTTSTSRCDGSQASEAASKLSSASSIPSGPLQTPPEVLVKEDDEVFGDYQSASTDPFAQPIYTTHDEDESETCLPKSEPPQSPSLFAGLGLVEPVHVRFDEASRGLRRAGKLWLRKLKLERDEIILKHVTVLSGGQVAELWTRADALNDASPSQVSTVEKEDTANSIPCTPDMNGVMRPVSFTSPHASENHREVVQAMDSLVEEEKQAWTQ